MPAMQGKIVWITGAGSGIGRAAAIAFAGAGAHVALTGRRRDALEETASLLPKGTSSAIVPADLARLEAAAEAHQAVVGSLGEVDVLVNNAGWNIGRRHWRDLRADDMAGVIDVDLKAPFALSIAVLPAMRRRREGTLVHISSLAAFSFNAVSGASYTAAKLGMLGMSDSINAEEGIHGIRSVAILPGEVATPILNSRPKPPSEEERGLMAQPDDIAAAALFCATLPQRTCVPRLVINPTDDRFVRTDAHAIAARTQP
jgi:NADP-dependent 3-hydroxy acid dehydrogenase YdfG